MNARIWAAVVVALLLFSAAGTFGGYRYGRMTVEQEVADAVNAQREKDREVITRLENEKRKRKVITRTKVKVVREAADRSGCLDTCIDPDLLHQLPGGKAITCPDR